MWGTLLAYVFPLGVSLYGLAVLLTGEVSGYGTRSVRGALARILGLLLVAALPLSLGFGSMVRIRPAAPKPDLDLLSQETEITREILAQHRQLQDWRETNMPDSEGEPADVEQARERLRELKEFRTRYDQQAAETEGWIKQLQEEQSRLRQEQAVRQRQAEAAGSDGASWVGLGVMLAVWGLASLLGRPAPENAPLSAGGTVALQQNSDAEQ